VELEKKFSVSIKYFPNTIAIFIDTYKWMHITTMPSYFSLHIYRNVEKYTSSDFEIISNNVKIDDNNIDFKIEKESQVVELLKLNL
jgi:hypothetical protein